MKRKRMISLVLTLALLFNLTACGGRTEESSHKTSHSEQPVVLSEDGKWLGNGGCYKLDRISENDYNIVKGRPDHLIFSNFEQLSNEDGKILFHSFMHDYEVIEDGIWCVCEKGMVDGEYSQDCYAVKLDFEGQELTRFDITDRADSFAVVSNKLYIFDAMNKVLAIYSMEGNKLGQVDISEAQLEEFSGTLFTGGDDSLWLFNDVKSGKSLYPVNLSDMKLGSPYSLPEDMEALSKGTKEHTFLLATQKELSYLDPVANTTSNILYWDECGVFNGELSSFIPDGDGFLCLSVTGLSRLRPAKPEEIHPRTRLTLGTIFRYDGSEDLAAQFNALSDDYYVDVLDYSNDGELERDDALKKMNTELLGGDGPDMIMLSDMGSLQNASVFTDLYPLLDADPELTRDDFYGLKAMETNDKLLLAPSSLTISTFYALPETVGDRTGWTWDEYFELESKLPPDGIMTSFRGADFFLKSSLDLYAPHAIDWVNGTCNFDTPEFVRILEAAKKGYDPNCPVENPYYADEVNAMMADGRTIIEGAYFFDAESFAQNESMLGTDICYIGWPTPDGSCGSVYNVSGVSIYDATDYKEGCWEFAKYVLKSTYAYKPTFEKAMAEATKPKEADREEQDFTLTQAQVDRYRKLMENITVAVSDNSEINDIVFNEADAMFAGYKTPEETAKLIQSRLSIYVAEHK